MELRKLIIRADGNTSIGLGHIYRGIALAEMLKADFDLTFVTRSNSTILPISEAGFLYQYLPDNLDYLDEPDWFRQNFNENTSIVCDGYEFKSEYQKKIKQKEFKLIYIDDLAAWHMYADVVINHAPGIKKEEYSAESYTKFALGLDYALIRQSFINFDREQIKRKSKQETILVSFGGVDINDFTLKAVEQLIKIEQVKKINIVLGAAYKHKSIFSIKSDKIYIHKNLSEKDVFNVMNECDLAIVPASTTSIELVFLGVPLLLGYFVENQKGIYKGIIEKGMTYPIGDFNKYNFNALNNLISNTINNNITETSNPKNHVFELFRQFSIKLREVKESDVKLIFNLSNEELVRGSSYNSELISYSNHVKWFDKQLLANKELFFVLEYKGNFCGQVRFTKERSKAIIGISISNEFRGKGIAANGLNMACNRYFRNNVEPIYAYIKKANNASVRSFEKAGFIFKNDEIINGADSFVYIKEKDLWK